MISEWYTPEVARWIAGTFATLTVLLVVLANRKHKKRTELIDILVSGIAGASIPSGLLMGAGFIDPTLYTTLSDLTVVGAVCGFAIVWYAIHGLKPYFSPQSIKDNTTS